jgi:hypothetical protein
MRYWCFIVFYSLMTVPRWHMGSGVIAPPFLATTLYGNKRSDSFYRRFIPRIRSPIPIRQEPRVGLRAGMDAMEN